MLSNDKFQGPVELDKNGLTDQAVLALADVLRKPGFQNITRLNLSRNAFTAKAGEYIGQALLDNCDNSKLEKLEFRGVDLGITGLVRIIDAANMTPALEKLDCGVLTDEALKMLSDRLAANEHLQELQFSETADHQKYWSAEAKVMFCDMLKTKTKLKKVKTTFQKCNWDNDESKEFLEAIDFYTDQKKKAKEKDEDLHDRMKSTNQEEMF